MSNAEPDADPILDECPDCGGANLEPADEINESFWDDTDTACLDCTLVFDARERMQGGFDSDTASELHSAAIGALKDALSEGSDDAN